MHLLEALESRTLLADTAGFAASASLSLDGRQSLDVQFTAPVSADPTLADIQLINRSTGQPLSTGLSLSVAADRKSIALTPAASSFPDGDYQLILDRFRFQDSAGDPLDFDHNFYFFILEGDLDRDRQVGISDFITLASNLGKSPASPADGDINHDGKIAMDDFSALSANFGESFAAPGNTLHLNAGGAAFTDSLARPFAAQSDFLRGAPTQTIFDIPYSTDDPLFNTYHSGPDFSFSKPIANGSYTLWLEFAEPVFNEVGQRTFDVFAEERQVLDDYDIFKHAGFQSPFAEAFNIAINDGALDLSFRGVIGDATISLIVLLPTEIPAPAKPYTLACGPESALRTQSARNLRIIGQGGIYYANDHKGRYPGDFTDFLYYFDQSARAFANPRAATSLPRGEAVDFEHQALARTLNDYILLFFGKTFRDIGDGPLGYENPDRVDGPIHVLLNDGHVELLDRDAAAAVLGIPIGPPNDPPPPRDLSNCAANPTINTSAANLTRLAQAAMNYANSNRGLYPPDLGTIYKWQYRTLNITDFLNPRRAHESPPPSMTLDQAAAWINENSDYLYFGNRMRWAERASFVLLAEKPDEFTDGINLLFNDGSVEFRELRWAIESLNFTDAQLPPPRPATALLSIALASTSTTADPSPTKPHRRHRHHAFSF
jgi:hypothetical protein